MNIAIPRAWEVKELKMQILLKIARGKSKSRNCEKCDKTFSNDGDLVNHTQEHIQDLHVNNKEVPVSGE